MPGNEERLAWGKQKAQEAVTECESFMGLLRDNIKDGASTPEVVNEAEKEVSAVKAKQARPDYDWSNAMEDIKEMEALRNKASKAVGVKGVGAAPGQVIKGRYHFPYTDNP